MRRAARGTGRPVPRRRESRAVNEGGVRGYAHVNCGDDETVCASGLLTLEYTVRVTGRKERRGMAFPAANWGGGGCAAWVTLPGHNALCKHDSVLPNSGPCCEPKEADRSAKACSTAPNYPCPSCLDQCGRAGVGGGSALYILGTTGTVSECETMASAFALDGNRCQGLTWIDPSFGEPWASKCICGTSDASWPTTVAAQDKCARNPSAHVSDWRFLLLTQQLLRFSQT